MGVGIYLHPDVTASTQRMAVAVWVKDQMGLNFLDESGSPVPSIADFITDLLTESFSLHGQEKDTLRGLAASASAKGGDAGTALAYLAEADALRRRDHIGPDREFKADWLVANKGWVLP